MKIETARELARGLYEGAGNVRMNPLPEDFALMLLRVVNPLEEMLDRAWGLIANVARGNWDREYPEWRQSAEKFAAEWRSVFVKIPVNTPAGKKCEHREVKLVEGYVTCAQCEEKVTFNAFTRLWESVATEVRQGAGVISSADMREELAQASELGAEAELLMSEAEREIERQRRIIEVLHAKVEVMELFRGMLYAQDMRGNGLMGMTEDIAWKLRQWLERSAPEAVETGGAQGV